MTGEFVSRVPECRIEFDENGYSVGSYDAAPSIRDAIDETRTALALGTRTLVVYGCERSPREYLEQVAAILSKPLTTLSTDTSPRETVTVTSAAGEAKLELPLGASALIVNALNRGEALLLAGSDDARLAAMQSVLASSLSEHAPLPITVGGPGKAVEVRPSPDALAMFAVEPVDEDARLWSSALLGGRAISLDDHGDYALAFRPELFSALNGLLGDDVFDDGGFRVNSPLPVSLDRERVASSATEATAAIRAGIDRLSLTDDVLQDTEPALREALLDDSIGTLMGTVTERIRAASVQEDSGIVSPAHPAELGARLIDAGINARLGDDTAVAAFVRGCDHLVSMKLTGEQRAQALLNALGEDALVSLHEHLHRIYEASWSAERQPGDDDATA